MSQMLNEQNAEELRTRGNNLLMEEPVGAGKATVFWKRLRSLDLMLLKKFWVIADPVEKRLDLRGVLFTEWQDNQGC